MPKDIERVVWYQHMYTVKISPVKREKRVTTYLVRRMYKLTSLSDSEIKRISITLKGARVQQLRDILDSESSQHSKDEMSTLVLALRKREK
jgi:hypothetical protein